jgi:hypothetical protein
MRGTASIRFDLLGALVRLGRPVHTRAGIPQNPSSRLGRQFLCAFHGNRSLMSRLAAWRSLLAWSRLHHLRCFHHSTVRVSVSLRRATTLFVLETRCRAPSFRRVRPRNRIASVRRARRATLPRRPPRNRAIASRPSQLPSWMARQPRHRSRVPGLAPVEDRSKVLQHTLLRSKRRPSPSRRPRWKQASRSRLDHREGTYLAD